MTKVIYFTAGKVATAGELTAIDALKAKQFDVQVRNAVDSHKFGPRDEATDYVAGTPPADYAAVTVFNNPGQLAATQAVVANAQQPTIPVTGTYATKATLTVAGGVVTAIALS